MSKNLKFKIASLLLSFFLIATPTLATVSYYVQPAYAGVNSFVSSGLNGANSVSNSGGAGVFHTQGENIYALGYSNVRFNTAGQSLQLFTITPPNFSIGCSGISAEWGAFAMLGSELMQVLQSIIQSGEVLVFAFNMVLGVLCKQCQTIMTQIEGIANKLNGLNFNSCQTAEAMGNIAGAELNSMLNLNATSGSSNDYHGSQKSLLGNVPTNINKYITDINTFMNCASNSQSAAALVKNNFKSCGEAAAADKFSLGSLLRNSLIQAHIGLIDGTEPGTGGANDLIGVLRGQFIGDVVGYASAAKKGEPVVKMFSPAEVVTTNPNGNQLTSLFNMLMFGSKNVTSMVIPFPPSGSVTNATSLSSLEEVTPNMCFQGFAFYYKSYLNQIMQSYFGESNFLNVGSGLCGTYVAPLSQSQMENLVTQSSVPVILVLKLAYVNNDPAIVETAADLMAAGYARSLFSDILKAVEINVMAAKNLDRKKKTRIWNIYVNQVKHVQSAIDKMYDTYESTLHIQQANLKYYANLNKAWVSSLSQYGLAGNYQYNP